MEIDHFGILTLWNEYMHFVPLNTNKRGVFDYVFSKNLKTNKIVEFKLNYSDLNEEEPMVMPIPSEEIEDLDKLDEFPINFNAQFHIYKTGYYALASPESQKMINSFKEQKLGIAEVSLKIPNFDLLNNRKNNE